MWEGSAWTVWYLSDTESGGPENQVEEQQYANLLSVPGTCEQHNHCTVYNQRGLLQDGLYILL